MRAIVVSILLFAATLPAAALAQSGYYFPVLETEISSEIVIGVVQSGTITDVAVTTIKTSRESSGSNTVTNTDVAVRNVEETRTKATNPAKRASRPKASGLLGGIVGAIGGDYSGLSQWGAGFVDHMMEPRDVTNVSKTFLTKNNRETRTVTTSASSWSNQNDFESTVTQNFQADISKGFIDFSVAVRNMGARSITIAEPTFVVFFESSTGSRQIAGEFRTPPGKTYNISQGATQIFPVHIGGKNFLTLSQQYRGADGVRVHIQDMKVQQADGSLQPIGQVWDNISDSRVRFDYFDGEHRSVQFIEVPDGGLSILQFVDLALSDTTHVFNNLDPEDKAASLVNRVGASRSDMRIFEDVPKLEKLDWRRWLISANDTLGSPVDPKIGDKVFPGYSVQLGYYAADQILPPAVYQPVVWESPRIPIDFNERVAIPVDLMAGDLIEIGDFEIIGYKIPEVSFAAAAAIDERCSRRLNGLMFPNVSTHTQTRPRQPPQPFDKCMSIRPQSYRMVDIDPKDMFIGDDGTPLSVPDDLAQLVYSMVALKALALRFRHFADLLTPSQDELPGSVSLQTNNLDQFFNTLMLQLFRPGESATEALNRLAVEELDFLYAVEAPIKKADSWWLFFNPDTRIPPGFALTSSSSVPEAFVGERLYDRTAYRYIPLIEFSSDVYYGAGSGVPQIHGNFDTNPLQGFRFSTSDGWLDGGIYWVGPDPSSSARALRVPHSTGPQLTARIRVLRFTEQLATGAE
ncbi:hypothetical protein [Parvibaculum sp.]|jgi:hypothetical protein|uniref:hypothetical protein n=1 Tax=Parvibaculum sp. TaxID=2024848 RepID=UPI002FD8BAEA